MWTHPGGRLLFMGNEFGQTTEWDYRSELNWHLLQYPLHEGLRLCVQDLNTLLRAEPALYENQFNIFGFEWIDLSHRADCVLVYRRKGKLPEDDLLILLNLKPEVQWNWEVNLIEHTYSKEIFNSDAVKYGGSGHVYNPDLKSELVDKESETYKLWVNLPPLASVVLK
jgi:1,4-alpha-glucan branching enzyme